MILINGEYTLRHWQKEDASALVKYANNYKIWQNLRDMFPHPYTTKDAEGFLTNHIAGDSKTHFAIANKSEAIGSIGLIIGKDVHRYTAELGYWLAEPFWGKGIMTQAVKSLTEYAINDLKLYRVFAEPYTTNKASTRVLEKAGYTQEAILRASVFKNGQVLDQLLYSFVQI